MANEPRSPIEWLNDKIRYEKDAEELRNIALVLLLSLEDPEPIHQYFGKEMANEGFYDDYKDEPYDDGSGWLGDDKADWDMALDLSEGHIKGVLGK